MKDLEDGEVGVESLEVAGVLEDEFGNKWSIPAGELSEDPSFLLADPLKVPNKDPRFHYEFVDDRHVAEYFNGPSQFRYVSRKEAGFGTVQVANPVEGAPVVTHGGNEVYRVGTLNLMKTPKVFADRLKRAQQSAADRAVEATLGTGDQAAAKRIRDSGLSFEIDRKTLAYKVIEKNPKPFRVEGEKDGRIERTHNVKEDV